MSNEQKEEPKEIIKEEELLKGARQEDVEVVDTETQSIIFSLMKQLKWGMDLTKIMIPCEFLEPRSLLEKLTDFLSHCDLINQAPSIKDPTERFLQVVKWYLSGWHVKSKGVKKPFNPILGELFRANYKFEDGSKLTYFAEQVSHHPPISALFGEIKEKGIEMNGWYYPKSKFYGNSAASLAEGELEVKFKDLNEVYQITWPDIYCRGIVIGKLVLEMCGETKIVCSQNKLEAKISFVPKPWIGGEYNHVETQVLHNGKLIAKIEGKWCEKYTIERNKKKELFFDVKTNTVKMNVPDLENQLDTESRKLWTVLAKAIKENNMENAAKEKDKIETENRNKKKDLEEKKQEYKQNWFKPGKNKNWIFTGHDSDEYKYIFNL